MKGFIDKYGYDRPACVTCKYRNDKTVTSPCYNCIDLIDLALNKPNCATNFLSYEADEPVGEKK